MPNPFDTRNQQLLVAIQTVPGVMETLNASHGKNRILYGGVPDYQAQKETRNLARNAGTPFGRLGGTKALGLSIMKEIYTPDDILTTVEDEALMRACAHSVTQYRRIPIGAITGGPIARGATMTGGTSGATGRVIWPAVTSDPYILFLPLTGTFQAEALTFTGGATASSSAVSAVYGRLIQCVKPTEIVSWEWQEDGYAWSARDSQGSLSMEFENSKAGKITYAMMGVKNALGKKTMTSGIAFETEDPPVFQDAKVKLGSWSPVVSKLSFEEAYKTVARGDANATGNTGLRGFRNTGVREAKFKMTVEHVDEDTFNMFQAHDDSTKYPFTFQCGTVDGKIFAGAADQVEVSISGHPDADGIRQAEIELLCTHTIDNREYEFLTR